MFIPLRDLFFFVYGSEDFEFANQFGLIEGLNLRREDC